MPFAAGDRLAVDALLRPLFCRAVLSSPIRAFDCFVQATASRFSCLGRCRLQESCNKAL